MSISLCVGVSTRCTADAAYRWVADGWSQHHPLWDDGVVRASLPTPATAGARGTDTRRFFGRLSTSAFEVVTADPPSRLVLRDEPGQWALTRTYTFTPSSDGGSRVSLQFDMQLRALPLRVLRPVLAPVISRQVRRTVRELGALLDDLA